MKQSKNVKEILQYNEKYGHIPKDYMERLAWLYKEIDFKPKHLESLLAKIDLLTNVEWNEINYIFYMTPKPTPRPKCARNTFHFYVGGAKFNHDIFERFQNEHSEMECVISTPCSLMVNAYLQTPKGMSIEEKIAAELEIVHNINAPDWDNLGKAYGDMVQDVLVSNDSLVFRGCVEKFYSVLPRIEVCIKFMTKYDCSYNKRTVEHRKSFLENDRTLKDIDYII